MTRDRQYRSSRNAYRIRWRSADNDASSCGGRGQRSITGARTVPSMRISSSLSSTSAIGDSKKVCPAGRSTTALFTPRAAATAASNAALSSATPSPLAPWSMTLITVRCVDAAFAWAARSRSPSCSRASFAYAASAPATHFRFWFMISSCAGVGGGGGGRGQRSARGTVRFGCRRSNACAHGRRRRGRPQAAEASVAHTSAGTRHLRIFFLPFRRVAIHIDHPWNF
mmetsp:Transcript_2642/g.8217  ORF Transcript_2642/g.8217 Transcript_2642/m.8217 type:complete len:226 (+) Transcript_2642:943-1620(+)